MKAKITILLTVFIVGVLYLLTPSPALPDLDGAVRSDEPGDTWQHPDQKAFYTNRVRGEVIPEMQKKFSTSFLGIKIPSFRLNYRPEESYEFIRDQVKSYYLEEIVYPFKESLFVSGWEPTNAPEFRHKELEDRPQVTYLGVTYLSKVTLRPVYSSTWARVFVWALVFPAAYLTYVSLKRSLSA